MNIPLTQWVLSKRKKVVEGIIAFCMFHIFSLYYPDNDISSLPSGVGARGLIDQHVIITCVWDLHRVPVRFHHSVDGDAGSIGPRPTGQEKRNISGFLSTLVFPSFNMIVFHVGSIVEALRPPCVFSRRHLKMCPMIVIVRSALLALNDRVVLVSNKYTE